MENRSGVSFERDEKEYDMIVIGAGTSGLAMARYYLEIHPDCRLMVIERSDYVGGVWSASRSYDHFWTQYSYPYGQFSDLEMEKPPEDDMYYGFYKAKHSTDYFEQYANHHSFSGRSIRDRIAFNTTVESVVRPEDRVWQIHALDTRSNKHRLLRTSKLAIASGPCSVPKMPVITGSESFNCPWIHTLDFGSSGILAAENGVKHITVLGGGKSAGDMVYAAIKAGKSVSWIVRPGGTGPGYYVSPKGPGPYHSTFDLGSTRLTEYLNPSIQRSENFFTKWLHETETGASLLSKLFTAADNDVFKLADYDGRPSKGGFEKLKPFTGITWMNGPGALLNHKDFFETVALSVEIHNEHISHLTDHRIHLQDGKSFETDALLCGTGWEHSTNYFTNELSAKIGLPYHSAAVPSETSRWSELDLKADHEMLARFPLLRNPPSHFLRKSDTEPFRLYNFIAPIDPDIKGLVVIGQVETTNYWRSAECQAIWATAYLDGDVKIPKMEEAETHVARNVALSRRRYLSTGLDGQNTVFSSLSYCDRLLAELGLRSHLGNVIKNIFYPTTPADLRGLKDEYIAKYKSHDKSD